MIVRPALLVTMLLMLAAPAPAQIAPTTGSVTIMSRPAGAWFRITGDQSVVGRTPMTLDRGLVGHYQVTGGEIGYERWRRGITLDGVSADTLWMALKTKSGIMAGARSLILPGWGQFYDDHVERGAVFMVLAAAAGAVVAVAEVRYHDRLDDYRAADAAYQAATTQAEIDATFEARRLASHRVDDAWKLRRDSMGAAIGVWGLSVLDAAIFVPRPAGPVLLGAAVSPALSGGAAARARSPGLAMTLARVRF